MSLYKTGELIVKIYKEQLPTNNIIDLLILNALLKTNIINYFNSIHNHISNQSHIHLLQLIKIIFKIFFTTRLNYHLKNHSQPNIRIRSHLTKIIHFRNQ